MQKKLTQHKVALNAAEVLTIVSAENMQHSFPFHTHNGFGIGIILKGYREEKYICPKTNQEINYTLKPNDIFFINPNEKHDSKTYLNDYKILFLSEKTLNTFLKKPYKKPHFKVHFTENIELFTKILHLFNILLNEEKISKSSTYSLKSVINEISEKYIECNFKSKNNINISNIKAYIQKNYYKNLSIAQLAQKSCMSPYHFIREFKKLYAITPHQYLLQERIKNSLSPKNRKYDFAKLALDLGFNDQSHFTNCFKKHVGLNPKKFHV